MSNLKLFSGLALSIGALAVDAGAQSRAPANCTYQQCALGLKPVWNGLSITRGESERQIANLGFFWPEDVSGVFSGNESAVAAAADAVRVRQVAAVLTDAGIVLLGTGIARAGFQRDFDRLSTVLTLVGATSLGVSVPFQFAADGFLSRAVWLYNSRFSP
ncbi:MAG: hypothetical protein ABI681_02600 [Gemmatimonadales bacterium]